MKTIWMNSLLVVNAMGFEQSGFEGSSFGWIEMVNEPIILIAAMGAIVGLSMLNASVLAANAEFKETERIYVESTDELDKFLEKVEAQLTVSDQAKSIHAELVKVDAELTRFKIV